MLQKQMLRAGLLLLILSGCLWSGIPTHAQKGAKNKSKKAAPAKAKKPASKTEKAPAEPKPTAADNGPAFHLDAFVGPSLRLVSGPYLEYQETYYQTRNPNFKIEGSFSNRTAALAGLQGRYRILNQGPARFLQIGVGAQFLSKGFEHNIQLTNTALNYPDRTSIKETYEARFVQTYLLIRYGKRLFVEGGVGLDWFLSGEKTRTLTRATEGDAAFEGPFSTSVSGSWHLSDKTMARSSLSWIVGAGYQIHPYIWARFLAHLGNGFFKEGDALRVVQPSIQLLITWPKG
jgi:hypothetical protein